MSPVKNSQTFTVDQIRHHRSKDSLYVVINNNVYDVTSFLEEHPGGQEVLIDQAGFDATEAFEEVGHSQMAKDMLSTLQVGRVKLQPGDEKRLQSGSKAYKSYHSGTVHKGQPAYWVYGLVSLVAAAVFFGWTYYFQE